MRERTRICEKWLTELDKYIGGIFLPGKGSMILAPRESDIKGLKAFKDILAEEGRELEDVSNEQALRKYGFVPRNSFLQVEKKHDRIFRPDFLDKIEEAISANGNEVHTDWKLVEILADVKNKSGGRAIFLDQKGNKQIVNFTDATLSLGITDIQPKPYVMSSVTGISMNALLYGIELKGPVVCGGSNHVVPLGPPKKIMKTDLATGKSNEVIVTPVRATAAASVSPRFRGEHSYDFPGIAAVELVRRLNQALPEGVKLDIVSAFGCNRMFGPEGMSTWLSPKVEIDGKKVSIESIRMQVGAGGGGLTQSAVEATRIAANPEQFFPESAPSFKMK